MRTKNKISILNLLFEAYINACEQDSAVIREDFRMLRETLEGMTPQEADRAVDAACKLCFDHERESFIEGVKAGVQLKRELDE